MSASKSKRVFWNTCLIWMGVTIAAAASLPLIMFAGTFPTGLLSSALDVFLALSMLVSSVTSWQLAGWWQCRFPDRPSVWQFILFVVVVSFLETAITVVVGWLNHDYYIGIEDVWYLPVWSLLWVALNIFVLRLSAPLCAFWHVAPGTESGVVRTDRWSIKAMIIVTSLAAGLFAMFRYQSEQIGAEAALMMPPLGLFLVIAVLQFARMLVLLFGAALTEEMPRRRNRFVMVVVCLAGATACAVGYDRIFEYWMDSGAGGLTVSMMSTSWTEQAVQSGILFLSHAWFFRRWRKAGFGLQLTGVIPRLLGLAERLDPNAERGACDVGTDAGPDQVQD
ncbi:hypothetical protein [Neorhodopirellula lusitana]|nr:hypothetical protein [Neorhodopirellula lusitana]